MNTGIDMVVSFDTTGSMYPVLSLVRNQVVDFVKNMFNHVTDLRIGVIAHGDYCDKNNPYTIRILDLTTDIDKICKFIRETGRTYGGDADECYELVLNQVRKSVGWEAGRKKILVMIGDASPHGINYPDNKEHIDWKNEAGLLNDLGVKIYAVHALSYYRDSSRKFYEAIAAKTGGKYLTLDQFNEVTELITATCMSEYDEKQLDEYISIIKKSGPYTRTMARNICRLKGEEYHDDMVKTKDYGSDGLIPVSPGRFQVMEVDSNCDIRGFVEKNGITFKKGRGFYELSKHETVQQYKEVIIQDRTTGEMFTGQQVRKHLGLLPQCEKGGAKESLSSRDTYEYRVFVQSTSYNRKLIAGTTFLYEIDDFCDVGSVVTVSDADIAREIPRVLGTDTTKSEDKAAKTKKSDKKPTKVKKGSTPKPAKPTKETKATKPTKETKATKPTKETKATYKKKGTDDVVFSPVDTGIKDDMSPETKLPTSGGAEHHNESKLMVVRELLILGNSYIAGLIDSDKTSDKDSKILRNIKEQFDKMIETLTEE